jgi:hypothetical protein
MTRVMGAGDEFLVPDGGPPDAFVGLFVLGLLVSVGIMIYKVTMARDLARKSGMDPDQATAMTLLEDDGLEATYLASNLRPSQPGHASPPPPPPAAERSVTDRLAELESLRAQDLVTQSEYDARRAAILDSL